MSSVTLHCTAESACAVFLFDLFTFTWFFALILRKLLFVCVGGVGVTFLLPFGFSYSFPVSRVLSGWQFSLVR